MVHKYPDNRWTLSDDIKEQIMCDIKNVIDSPIKI